MDDNQFDDLFRQKLDELDPAYQESYWQEFNSKLKAYRSTGWPWSRWLIIGGLTLATLINILWGWDNLNKTNNPTENANLQPGLPLKNTPEKLIVTDTIIRYDTVYIEKLVYTSRPGSTYAASNSQKRNFLSSAYHSLNDPTAIDPTASILDQQINKQRNYKFYDPLAPQFKPISWNTSLKIAFAGSGRNKVVKRTKYEPLRINLSGGTGIRIPYIDEGLTYLNNSLYLSAEIFKKPYDRLQLGISYFQLQYLLDDTSDPDKFRLSDLSSYPGLQGSPDQIVSTMQVLQFPVYYRRYEYLTNKWSLIAGAGITLDWIISQEFNYKYISIENGQINEYNVNARSPRKKFNLGTAGAMIGLQYELNDRASISGEMNYQIGLTPQGLDQRTFNQLIFNVGLGYLIK
ncbi:MAG: hypothetical protein ACNS62_23575 [Candidatus Cyclobacteriaceae bacterium M3_2C_046]